LSRYYKVDIGSGQFVFTNQLNGKLDPGALRVELQIEVAPFATPTGQSLVTIWGVPLTKSGNIPGISQTSDLNQMAVTVSGGMQDGLPLATRNTPHAGVLISGMVLQAYGNWMDVNQSIGLVISSAGDTTKANPANIVLAWKKGQKLADALQQTLATAFPTYKLNIKINDNLVLQQDETGTYDTLQQLAPYVQQVSQSIIKTNYPGVNLWIGDNVINATDLSSPGTPVVIDFVDLMGQPTWLNTQEISFSTVMRADISIDTVVQLPALSQQQSITNPDSLSQYRNRSAFQGQWQVTQARHIGDSRAANAMSWISTFQAFSLQAPEEVTSPVATAS
jgi:hypothetical protein